jgi:hypothetical protein
MRNYTMDEYELDIEISALWREIVNDNPQMDVDQALTEACAMVAALLMDAAAWDLAAAAMRDTAQAPIASRKPACPA